MRVAVEMDPADSAFECTLNARTLAGIKSSSRPAYVRLSVAFFMLHYHSQHFEHYPISSSV